MVNKFAIAFVLCMTLVICVLVFAVPHERYVEEVMALLRDYKDDSEPVLMSHKQTRGIVMVAGGPTYGPMAYHSVQVIRKFNPDIAIQIYSLSKEEQRHTSMQKLAKMPQVELFNLGFTQKGRWVGWRSKIVAIQQSSFDQLLYLDADNQVLGDVAPLFDLPEFQKTGAVFWPDNTTLNQSRTFALSYLKDWNFNIPSFLDLKPNSSLLNRLHLTLKYEHETGQILLDKTKVNKALNLIETLHNHYTTVFRLFYGDKDVYQFAFSYLKIPFTQVEHRPMIAGYLDDTSHFCSLGLLQRHPTTAKPMFYHKAGLHSNYNQKITHVQTSNDWESRVVVDQFGLIRYDKSKISVWNEQILNSESLQITAAYQSK